MDARGRTAPCNLMVAEDRGPYGLAMPAEEPKRLPLTSSVVRNLYALSGNRCPWEGCEQVLVESDGTLVGEVAHIRAAKPDGARFDPSMTNEGRRDQSNLMIFCRNHHKMVDSRGDCCTDR
ncbi:hypothetical protein [Janibacter indicus]|uniref:hypothetical protein n=1 Tax=Janibacter indicus TaxID=857417 RepID=UPI003EB89B6F